MMSYIESEPIKSWLLQGLAVEVSSQLSSRLSEQLKRYPWSLAGTGLDWQMLSGKRIDLKPWGRARDLSVVQQTLMAGDSHLVFWFADNQPSIACDIEFALNNLDAAYYRAPGRRFLFGAVNRDGHIEPNPEHVAEFDNADTLIIRASCGPHGS